MSPRSIDHTWLATEDAFSGCHRPMALGRVFGIHPHTPRSDEMPDKGPGSKSGGKKPKGGKAEKKKK